MFDQSIGVLIGGWMDGSSSTKASSQQGSSRLTPESLRFYASNASEASSSSLSSVGSSVAVVHEQAVAVGSEERLLSFPFGLLAHRTETVRWLGWMPEGV